MEHNKMKKYITTKKTVEEDILLEKKDFEEHGQWGEMNRQIATMYTHIPTGMIFYSDCPEARERGLLIYPF
mgnify:CR=1 FL=1|tara:strand:+ start:8235 stop:8447 length:213 start_codon:yes stop_codon:yes gene_type:complete